MGRTAAWTAIAVGLAALLAGCTQTGAGPTPSAATVTASATASSSSAASATAAMPASSAPASSAAASSAAASSAAASSAAASSAPAQPSSADPNPTASATRTDPGAPKGQCADSALRLDIQETGGGLGSRQDLIVFRNAGTTTCALAGAPGVSVVGDGNGTQLGQPAGRGPGASEVFQLKPGDTVTAELDRISVDGRTTTFSSDGDQVACDVQKGDGYRIYPPHSFKAVLLRRSDVWACTSKFVWMHVSPVVAGK